MKNNFTLVKTFLLLLCLGIFSGVTAQIQFQYTPSQSLAAPGQTNFEVDVRVSDFENIVAAQFTLIWNSAVLQIDSLPHITTELSGLNQSSFSLPNQTTSMELGRINFAWTDPTTLGSSLPDNSFLFTMKFSVIGQPCDTTRIKMGDIAFGVTEAINSDFIDIGVSNLELPIEIAGTDCTNFANTMVCNDEIFFSLNPNEEDNFVTPDMILEGGPYDYSVMTVSPSSVSCDDFGPVLVTVINGTTGGSCWGNLNVQGAHCDGFSETMTCNSLVNVSVTPWGGSSDLTPDMILEGGPYDFSVMSISPSEISCDDIGTPISVTVTNNETGISCFGVVNVEDKTPPVAVAKQNIVVELTQPPSGGPIEAKLFAESVDNGSFDNCTAVTFSPAFWEFNCSDIGIQDVTLTVTDAYGNFNQTWTTVTIELKLNSGSTVTCPEDVVVDCTVDITSQETIENILGQAYLEDGCALPYSDVAGYDANNDGDLDDTHVIGSETINESYFGCPSGTVVRTWSSWGTADSTCVQLIGIQQNGDLFDGLTMIDWPYSLNSVVDNGDNDSGLSCSNGCSAIDADDIVLDYDNNGVLTGCSLTTTCGSALCEEPLFIGSACSLLGYSADIDTFILANGDTKIIKYLTVIDWCNFDPADSNTGGIWNYTIVANIIGGGSEVNFSAAEISGKQGDQVCLPIRVSNFNEIESLQGSLSWDENIASFSNVTSFGLAGLNNSSFGLFDTDNGKLSYLWIDQTGTTPASLTDDSALFSVCFDLVGNTGQSTAVSFSDSPTEMEVTSNFVNLPFVTNDGSITISDNNCTGDSKAPTPYCINLSTAVMQNGEVELWAQDFDIGSFDNCTPGNKLRFTFTDVNPSSDPNFAGRSSRKIYTAADINNQQSATVTERMYVWDENDNVDYCQISITLINNGGTGGSDDITLQFGNVATNIGGQICMPLTVGNFSNIETFQGSIDWDPTVAEFVNLNGFNVPGLSESLFNTGNSSSGSLSFLWFDVTGTSPLTLTDGSRLFEVCFEAVGSPGDVTNVSVVNTPVVVEVTKPGSPGGEAVNLVSGSFSILNSNCSIEESQITWPLAQINVNEPNANSANSFNLLSPANLLTFAGIEYADVYPTFDVTPECEGSIAYTYEDTVFQITGSGGEDQIKVVREWTVLDWNTGSVFTFAQVIQNYLSGLGICDTLPNSAPPGDCASGHTLEDDVEWPDDLNIADHRITPSELVTSSGVDPEDAKPIFYNVPELYQMTYADSIGGLSQTNLNIKRIWSVTRVDFPGQVWKYIQCIDVDLTQFGKLVTVSTLNKRPLSDVILNASDMTNQEGFAYTEEEANPSRSDIMRNGLNIKDMMMIQAAFLGEMELSDNQKIAADYSNDGAINAIDMIQIRKLLLGIDSNSDIDWKFNDVTSDIESGLEPKGHYIAIKPGDVDDSADIGLDNPVYLTENLIFEDRLLNAGELYLVPMYIGSDMQALGTELNLTFNNDKVEITSVNSDQVFGSISFNIINDNRLAMITENSDLSVETIDSQTPLLTIEILATKNGTLKEVFGVSDIDESFILDSEYNLIKIDGLIEGEIILDNENLDNTLAIDVYPNPAVDYLIIDDNNTFVGQDIHFELFDVTGQRILNTISQKQVSIAHLISGMYVYKITVGDKFTSGRIIKQ